MLNCNETRIVITLKDVDNAKRLKDRLQNFSDIAAIGGDVELMVRHDGIVKSCGFVAQNLDVKSIDCV